MFYQISLSPQVKQWAIVTYKHGIYELPYQLPNNLPAAHTRKMTQDPRKLGNIRKVPRPDRTISPAPRPPPPPRGAPPHTKTRAGPKYPATDCRMESCSEKSFRNGKSDSLDIYFHLPFARRTANSGPFSMRQSHPPHVNHCALHISDPTIIGSLVTKFVTQISLWSIRNDEKEHSQIFCLRFPKKFRVNETGKELQKCVRIIAKPNFFERKT